MKKCLLMPSLALAAMAAVSGGALAAQPSGQPVPPPPRSGAPTSPATSTSALARPDGLRGPPAEELVRQITAGRSFPIEVDAVSRLDSVQGHGDTLTYNYTITSLPDTREERLQLSQRVKDGIDARACATPDFAKLLEGGYTVLLNYDFGNPDEDVHMRVTPRRCTR